MKDPNPPAVEEGAPRRDATQPTAVDGMSYIDRLVFEAESGGRLDARVRGGDDVDVDRDDDERGGGEDSDSNWSDDYDSEEELSDDELEYDSDEETFILQSVAGEHKRHKRSFGGNLSEEGKELLLWRHEDSFSDWKIIVSVEGEGGGIETVYNVHKFALGAGPKKSEYCEAIFKSGQFNESINSTTELTLPEYVATFFPDFLDYMYCQPSECACLINRENRRSLQHLARYLIVPKLTSAIHEFVEEDMRDLNRMEGYLSEFGGAEDDESMKILSMAGRLCAERVLELNSSLVMAFTSAMMLHVLKAARSSKGMTSLPPHEQWNICNLAVDYVRHHQHSLNTQYFYALTSELYFPDDIALAGDVAIDLLEIMKLTGWEESMTYGNRRMCTTFLSSYLKTYQFAKDSIDDIVVKMPENVLRALLVDALTVEKVQK